MAMFAQWYLDAMEDNKEYCHCGMETFRTDDPTFAQFMETDMCRDCIDVRCDAFPGACKEETP